MSKVMLTPFNTKRVVYFVGEVTSEAAQKLYSELLELHWSDDNNREDIVLVLDSVGGETITAMAIYDFLSSFQHQTRINVHGYVFGMAYSSAVAILQGCATRIVSEHSYLMLHEDSVTPTDLDKGTLREHAADSRAFADQARAITSLVAKAAGRSLKDVLKLEQRVTYLSAAQAIEEGFADSVFSTPPPRKAGKLRRATRA